MRRRLLIFGAAGAGGGADPLAFWQSQLAKYGGPGWACQDKTDSVAEAKNKELAEGRNVLIDGDMEAADASAYTATNATLSKQAGTRTGGSGSLVLRVVADGVSSRATQVILAIGKTYRVTGWVRTDASTVARVKLGDGTNTIFQSASSATWQYFDVTGTANATTLRLNTVTIGQYAEWDDVTVTQTNILASSAYPGAELLVDGDMEAATTAAWTAFSGAILSKQTGTPHGGIRVLRVATPGGDVSAWAQQVILTVGKRYRVVGWVRSDGVGIPHIGNASGTDLFTGTTSTSWQLASLEFTAASENIFFGLAGGATQYVEWDDTSVTEVNPINAPITGATVGVTIGPAGLLAFSYDATNDKLEPGVAETNSMFTPDAFTLEAYIQVSGAGVWTDNTLRVIAVWYAGADNFAQLSKNAANQLQWDFKAGGTLESIVLAVTPLTPILMTMTVDVAGVGLRAFYNGAETGSAQSVAGTFVGNITPFIGALNTTPDNVWDGLEALIANYRAVKSDADILNQAKSLGVA